MRTKSNLLFLKYQNEFNRLINPIGALLTDYYSPGDDVYLLAGVNFHQRNGIITEQVLPKDFDVSGYDYLLVADAESANGRTIVSRWFITGKEDDRNGMCVVSLKRDLISDFFDDVKKADFMMVRGNLDFGNVGTVSATRKVDPLLFQPEGKEYNQVKKNVYYLNRFGLSHGSEPTWIIGYVAKNIKGYQTVEIPEVGGLITFGKVWGLEFSDSKIQSNIDDAFDIVAMPYLDCKIQYTDGGGTTHVYQQSAKASLAIMTSLAAKGLFYDIQLVPYITGMGSDIVINTNNGNVVATTSNFSTPNSGLQINHFEPFEYGVYKGNYPGDAQCAHSSSSITVEFPADWPTGGTLESVVFVSDTGATEVSDWHWWEGKTTYSLKNSRYKFVSGTDYNVSGTTITFVDPQLKDDLFNMMDNGKAHLELVYKYGSNPGNIQPLLMSLAKSKETFSLSHGAGNIAQTAIKEENELKLYRLVSPNHNGIFEWSPAKDFCIRESGTTTNWNCTSSSFDVALDLKPFDPYIRVCPNFTPGSTGTIRQSGLYGTQLPHGRGLICDGDFSLTMPTSAWQQYKLNNKTFASSFSRELTTLDKKNMADTIKDATLGIGGATAAGAVAGAKFGGAYGAIAGAVAGVGIGGYRLAKNIALRQDQVDKMKAEFNMNIRSIMARPDSITKVSPLDPDNTLFPCLEVYEATDEEKAQFRAKMRLTGMLANKETTIESQMTNVTVQYPLVIGADSYQYFEGSIIRMPSATDATPEMIEEINNQLSMGVYLHLNLFN